MAKTPDRARPLIVAMWTVAIVCVAFWSGLLVRLVRLAGDRDELVAQAAFGALMAACVLVPVAIFGRFGIARRWTAIVPLLVLVAYIGWAVVVFVSLGRGGL